MGPARPPSGAVTGTAGWPGTGAEPWATGGTGETEVSRAGRSWPWPLASWPARAGQASRVPPRNGAGSPHGCPGTAWDGAVSKAPGQRSSSSARTCVHGRDGRVMGRMKPSLLCGQGGGSRTSWQTQAAAGTGAMARVWLEVAFFCVMPDWDQPWWPWGWRPRGFTQCLPTQVRLQLLRVLEAGVHVGAARPPAPPAAEQCIHHLQPSPRGRGSSRGGGGLFGNGKKASSFPGPRPNFLQKSYALQSSGPSQRGAGAGRVSVRRPRSSCRRGRDPQTTGEPEGQPALRTTRLHFNPQCPPATPQPQGPGRGFWGRAGGCQGAAGSSSACSGCRRGAAPRLRDMGLPGARAAGVCVTCRWGGKKLAVRWKCCGNGRGESCSVVRAAGQELEVLGWGGRRARGEGRAGAAEPSRAAWAEPSVVQRFGAAPSCGVQEQSVLCGATSAHTARSSPGGDPWDGAREAEPRDGQGALKHGGAEAEASRRTRPA